MIYERSHKVGVMCFDPLSYTWKKEVVVFDETRITVALKKLVYKNEKYPPRVTKVIWDSELDTQIA